MHGLWRFRPIGHFYADGAAREGVRWRRTPFLRETIGEYPGRGLESAVPAAEADYRATPSATRFVGRTISSTTSIQSALVARLMG